MHAPVRSMGLLTASLCLAVAGLAADARSVAAADAPGSCSSSAPGLSSGTWLAGSISTATDTDWYRFSLASTRPVQVTLGSLGANLRFDLFKGCSTRIAGSDRSGRQFEELLRSLGSGSYYVRVRAAASGVTGSYAIRLRTLTVGLPVLSLHATVAGSILHIAGEVANTSAGPMAGIKVVLTARDSSGASLGSATVLPLFDRIGSFKRTSFAVSAALPAGFSRVTAVASGSTSASTPIRLDVTAISVSVASGTRTYTGRVTNATSGTIYGLQVVTTLYDSKGSILTAALGSAARMPLAVGGTSGVSVKVPTTTTPNTALTIAQVVGAPGSPPPPAG